MELKKVQRQRAVDGVYQELRQAIVCSAIKPGERLNVYELASAMGVSLTPVRSAIQQLATQGLVEIRPRSGTFVASLTPREVEETFKIRCALECLAGEDAVRNIRPQQLRRLRELLGALSAPVRHADDQTAHERNNSELHQIIIQASGNQRLREMYHALHAQIQIARIHAVEVSWLARLEEEQAEHQAIIAALEARDGAALTAALRKHIYRAKDVMISALQSLGRTGLGNADAAPPSSKIGGPAHATSLKTA